MSADPAAPASQQTPIPGHTGAPPISSALHHPEHDPQGRRLAMLTLTALGVVYGDIGTSPLYALRECFRPEYGIPPSQENVYGILSLILWALILVVSVKYIGFIMRADNRGEGGILSLLALLMQKQTHRVRRRMVLVGLGLFGAALLYGDGMITPAISVLSAVEGLEVVSPNVAFLVVPLTLAILVGIFLAQRFGTARVGVVFGPITLVWFITIGGLGLWELRNDWHILAAVNPLRGLGFLATHGVAGFLIMGAVVLAVTGAEALYADMGHFGKRPIRLAWFGVAFPALLLNYFGQGALILRDASAAANPFYLLAPRPLLYPTIAIATLATIIASQAMISGAFSITQQCIQLGYSPRMQIVHTSAREHGQIYIPEVNFALMAGCILLVLGFGSSAALGAAYGIAVTGTFVITTSLFFVLAWARWRWPLWQALAFLLFFLVIDLALFGATLVKVVHGGWVPLLVAATGFLLMTSWKRGRDILRERLREISMPLETFLGSLDGSSLPRVAGTAVFMTSEQAGAPVVLLHHLKHNKALHQQVILLSIKTADIPEVPPDARLATVERLPHGFIRVVAQFGFMQSPDVKEVMQCLRSAGVQSKPMDTSYYLGREQLIAKPKAWRKGGLTMNYWRKLLFALMATNARSAAAFFGLPPNRVVELGTQIEF